MTVYSHLLDSVFFVDFECTGLNFEYVEIDQFSAAWVVRNGRILMLTRSQDFESHTTPASAASFY